MTKPILTHVFVGGPLNGQTIPHPPRCLFRAEDGFSLTVSRSHKLLRQGRIYVLVRSAVHAVENGKIVAVPGVYQHASLGLTS
jgi:hypothetical protein